MVSDDHEGFGARGYAAGVVGSTDGGRAGSACGIDLQDGDGFSSKMAVLPEPLFLYSSCRFWKRENRGKAAFPAQPAGCDKPRRNVASRLVLREFVGRTLLETLLVLPGIVSLFMLLLSKDGKSLRDRLAGTVVVQDTSYLG